MISAPFTANWGSPPRMRGKDFHVGDGLRFAGITPAYAGKRGGFHRQLSRVKDHPRVCGEKQVASRQTTTHLGSPPRMRGKAAGVYAYSDSERITPAYAGKSFFCPDRILWDRDHPRVCGEKLYMPCAIAPNVGSPPRMRGKVAPRITLRCRPRITPAYAGKSGFHRALVSGSGDHPRVCGEKFCFVNTVKVYRGSPPRMRGKVDFYYFYCPNRRITPAYAGKSNCPLIGCV